MLFRARVLGVAGLSLNRLYEVVGGSKKEIKKEQTIKQANKQGGERDERVLQAKISIMFVYGPLRS